jgi:SanA protein
MSVLGNRLSINTASIKKWLGYLALFLVLTILLITAIDRWVSYKTRSYILTPDQVIPHYQVAVVLGTSKYLGHTLNIYYTNRIQAAINLYNRDIVSYLLLSGDNAHRSYNEPWTMKRDLLKAGVPESHIALDYAGFRTLDSIVRAKRIFDTNHFLIITQGFHCERALFIAQHHHIDASCLAVPGPSGYSGFYIRMREVLARVKAVIDLYILNSQPKFLGPKEPIIIEDENVFHDQSSGLESIHNTPRETTVP